MVPLTPLSGAFVFVAMLAVMVVPRRWAPVPMLLVTCYMTPSVGVMLGEFSFFALRLLILAGLIRVFLRGEYRGFLSSPLDRLMVIFSIWAIAASAFRSDPVAILIGNGGSVFNIFGVYFLLRSWCRNLVDVFFLFRIMAWLLVPIAVEMVYENMTASNLFSQLGGVPEVPEIREGRIRAQGPFASPIMAGTVGAAMVPVFLGLVNRFCGGAMLGLLASITMVFASASSGPLMSVIFGILGLLLWTLRSHMSTIRWAALAIFGFLMVVMNGRAYYLIARIDLVGGSASWHRARLIDMSIAHLGEWWLAGTDYTRHWMPTGVPWSPNHTDITNAYLGFGVQGGLPLLLLFVLLFTTGFLIVGRSVQDAKRVQSKDAFFIWSMGSSLFVHAATGVSVAYIDQSFFFFVFLLATIASLSMSTFLYPAIRQSRTQLVPSMLRLRRSTRLTTTLLDNTARFDAGDPSV